ncbi:MAG: hypothetical protein WCI29_06785 [Actinomycetes bacterium]
MTALRLLPELEDSLRTIPGVRAASVVTGPDGRPTEVHVLAQPGKAAKQVVRDVQSVAMAQFDLDIDHRIVSVVLIGDDAVEVGEANEPADFSPASSSAPRLTVLTSAEPAPTRPALTSIRVSSANGDSEVEVTLTVEGSVFVGLASGPAALAHRPRIVATATLAALSEMLGMSAQIESAQIVSAGLREAALCVLSLQVPRLGEQILCGSALVRGDAEDAVSRSVLAAVNRRLAP